MSTQPKPLTAEEYLEYLISIALPTGPGPVRQSHLVMLRKLIVEGKTGVYVP